MHERVISVGHAIVVTGLLILAIWSLARCVLGLMGVVTALPPVPPANPEEATTFATCTSLFAWMPLFMCAWGIWKWRRWGRILAIALCGLVIALELEGLILFGETYLASSWIAQMAVSLVLIVWLSSHPVRVKFLV